uniref:Outer mitochondrial transmembrane helix translocase n=1 Tax=Cyprinus carpio TaxID=7962 RepID=A0A8C1UEQ8_CYPCA
MELKKISADNIIRPLNRNDVISLIIHLTAFGAFGTVTYFTIKWMVDAIDPPRKQKAKAQKQAEKLMQQIGVLKLKLSEYEMNIAAYLVDPLTMQITWHDIAGLDEVITELRDTVIFPIQNRDLFKESRLLQPPKGVLLHGPPGCGKTLIAKATANEAGFRFINLQSSSLTDKWYGESQKLAAAVFSLAIKLQPSVIFIDEIDSFLRSRSSSDHEATAMMQFMSLWDGLDTDYNSQLQFSLQISTKFHIFQPVECAVDLAELNLVYFYILI